MKKQELKLNQDYHDVKAVNILLRKKKLKNIPLKNMNI